MKYSTLLWVGCVLSFGQVGAAALRLDLRPRSVPETVGGRFVQAVVAHELGILRQTDLGAGVTMLPTLEVGTTIDIELYDNVRRSVLLKERLPSSMGGCSFLATTEGTDGLLNVAVVQTSDGLQLDIQDFRNARVYTVFSSSEGTTVREIDPRAGRVTACDAPVPTRKVAESRAQEASASGGSTSVVDVLVAYDQGAASWAKRNGGGLDAFALTAVAKMNTALANNGLDSRFRFRLVGTVAADAFATDVHVALNAIDAGKTGWSAIRAKRDEVGADVVTTLIDTGSAYGTTGVGWSLETKSIASFAESAYNVCAVRAVAQDHTMTHEVGHNMGAGHATAVEPSQITPGPQLYDYSAGHYFWSDGTGYHTIMAYNYDGYGRSYDPAPLFSSPSTTWKGVPVGDATHDNARTLANTYEAVAQWRAQKIPLSYDVSFSPETKTTFKSTLTVVLTPSKAGLPVRYTTDGTEPTLASRLYSGPFTITATTTVKAAAVSDGTLGPVFEAHYLKEDLGTALNAPQLVWTTSADCPWDVRSREDGVDGADYRSDGLVAESCPDFVDGAGAGKVSWLKTTVTGPTEMGFRYQKIMYDAAFKIYCDGKVLWSDTESDYSYGEAAPWLNALVAIPPGRHEIRFAFEKGYGYYYGFNGIAIESVNFDTWSPAPILSPATTDDELTALTFTGSLTVTLTPPAGRTGKITYTTDDSDPTGDQAKEYKGPFVITRSSRVQAIFVEEGHETGLPVRGYYLERHAVKPGEWTTDVAGVKAAAAKDGGLIAVLSANRRGCYWTQQLMPEAESPEFLAWAAANGVYLITSDRGTAIDTRQARSYFSKLWGGSMIYYPSFAFAWGNSPEISCMTGTARQDGASTLAGVPFENSYESLIAGFAAVMGRGAPSAAPRLSPDIDHATAFPIEVTLSNVAGSGEIYYTLDGSAPTRTAGTRYAGAIKIPRKDVVLTAAVVDASGNVGIPLVRRFRLFGDFVNELYGTEGLTWTEEGPYGWQQVDWWDEISTKGLETGGYGGTSRYVSTLTVKTPGRGRLRFTAKVSTDVSANRLVVRVNGTPKHVIGGYVWKKKVTDEILAAAGTTVSWRFEVDDPSDDRGSAYYSGVGVYDVSWVSYEPDAAHYAVLFEANGGAGVMDAQMCEPHRVYSLAPCSFVPPAGKRLVGWVGSNGRRYDPGMLVFDLAKPGETVTLTAVWE